MKKQAKDLKKGDKINIAGKSYVIEAFELSEIGKQGKRKVRIEAVNEENKKLVLIRPEDYPFQIL